jgi:hypothetical protein
MSRPADAIPPTELRLTPELVEQLAIDAHYAHAETLAQKLRSLAAAKAEADDPVPEVVVRMGEEHAYRFAQAVAKAIFGMTMLVVRLGRAAYAALFGDAARMREQLVEPLASIRTLAEVLRDNPTLSAEERARLLGIIVDQSDRFDRLVGSSLKAPSNDQGLRPAA